MDESRDHDRADLTSFLNRLARGQAEAAATLMPRVLSELHAIADAYLRRQPAGHTLQPTALVNEAFLRLFDADGVGFNDRKHFFALSARSMRQVLVDHARAAQRDKRGGGRLRVTLDERLADSATPPPELLDFEDVLQELGRLDERQARIVELRFFGGLDVPEVAEVMSLSKSTVEREWRAARAWLGVRLEGWGA
jgi:RNA polymerase sigma factor (TIGR02999 family)